MGTKSLFGITSDSLCKKHWGYWTAVSRKKEKLVIYVEDDGYVDMCDTDYNYLSAYDSFEPITIVSEVFKRVFSNGNEYIRKDNDSIREYPGK